MIKSFLHKGVQTFFQVGSKITSEGYAMGQMHNPMGPGKTLREDVLPAPGLTAHSPPKQRGITRTELESHVT